MQDTQMYNVSTPHEKSVTNTITIKDFFDASSQNINPLTIDYLKKILDQSKLQAKLCNNPILVSVEELQKAVTEVTRDKVNPQEPPSTIPSVTHVKSLIQPLVDTSTKVDTLVKVDTIEK